LEEWMVWVRVVVARILGVPREFPRESKSSGRPKRKVLNSFPLQQSTFVQLVSVQSLGQVVESSRMFCKERRF
jgi:hypothetical protein